MLPYSIRGLDFPPVDLQGWVANAPGARNRHGEPDPPR